MTAILRFSLLTVVLAGGVLFGEESQTVTLAHKVKVPGATLEPGEYNFSLEDRLQDRAIIRVTNTKNDKHELLLAVPNDKLNTAEHGKLLFFLSEKSDKQVLQGWICPNCQSALEVVYPKDEAVAITGDSAKPVMAVDPTFDKLPSNLSADDMKVVTLWLLSPKEITPEQKGKGVEAAKYADIRNARQQTQPSVVVPSSPATANTPVTGENERALNHPAAIPAQETTAAVSSPTPAAPSAEGSVPAHSRHMPHTASNTYNDGVAGLAMLVAGVALYAQRRRRLVAEK